MKFNPFCCLKISVLKTLKTAGYLQLVTGVFSIVLISMLLITYDVTVTKKGVYFYYLYEDMVPRLCLSFYGIGMGTLLLIGAAQRNYKKCLIWLFGTAMETFVYLILASIMLSNVSRGETVSVDIGYFIQIVLNVYLMLIVYACLDEPTSDPTATVG